MTKRSLREIKKQKLNKHDIEDAAKKAGIKADVNQLGDIGNLEETIEQYQNKDEDELMGDLFDMVEQGREDGSFSEEMLDQFIQNVSPMLDSEQKKKLGNIANMLKQK